MNEPISNNKNLNFIDFLIQEFKHKQIKNNKYSLRSFARDLNINAGTLSLYLKRKRVPTLKIKNQILERLKVPLVVKTKILEQKNNQEDELFNQLECDAMTLITHWYFDAICELTRINEFKSDSKYIAEKLGITIDETNEAINSLLKENILKKTTKNKLVEVAGNDSILGNNITTEAMTRLQTQILKKALDALQSVNKISREQKSMVMAINKKDIPKVKEEIKIFHRKICKYLQRPNRSHDAVYQLVTTFFPLTID